MIKKLLILTTLSIGLFANQEIVNSSVKIQYSYKYKGPTSVEYTLTKDKINKKNIKKRPLFYKEPSLPKQYQVDPKDYIKSTSTLYPEYSYDRGHMAPDADFDFSKNSLKNVYTMANVVPQERSLNRGLWAKAERYERFITNKLNSVHVTNIIEYKEKNFLTKKQMGRYKNALDRKHIYVPSGFWKIITARNFKKCFFFKNKPLKGKLKDYLVNPKQCPNKKRNKRKTSWNKLF